MTGLTLEELRHLHHCMTYRAKVGGWSIADRNSGGIDLHKKLLATITAEIEQRESDEDGPGFGPPDPTVSPAGHDTLYVISTDGCGTVFVETPTARVLATSEVMVDEDFTITAVIDTATLDAAIVAKSS
jgi:hypothetical protein